ncbi:hypothetical protein [Marinobacter sp. VGCF2001]|uniref:hypothetical protein n=1 Tax=Marinobacter sp. VGCF2001 TaxID=3417189 RepID=UPI003CEFE19F
MNGRTYPLLHKCMIVMALFGAGLAAPAASALDGQLATGVVRFSLDTGEPARVAGLAAALEGESADYLRARWLLSSGQKEKAREVFRGVFAGTTHRGEAALALAEMALHDADAAGAEKWYQQARQTGYGEVVQKALLGLAEQARNQGKTDAAGQYLARMDDGYWAAVGYMNLAADFARDDVNASRGLVALRVAMAMAAKDQAPERSRALLDQLNLRAGYLALGDEQYDKAIDFLERVSLDSYHTPQALYLHGLALSEKGNHRAAMQSWHRAKKFPLAFPGVADAWIGMGRGYDLSGYAGQAGESWLAANAAYESERVTLGSLAKRIREQGAYKTLVQDARNNDLQWFLADSRTLTQPRLAYLMRFMEAPDAQNAVRRVAQLDEMLAVLDENKANLTVFIQALERVLHSSRKETRDTEKSELIRQQASLEARLDQLLAKAPASVQGAALDRLQETLSVSGDRLAALTQRIARQPERLNSILREASAVRDSTEGLQQRALTLRQQAARELDAQALAFVEGQSRRMTHALDKTEQQIAHLYEYLALENLGEGTP